MNCSLFSFYCPGQNLEFGVGWFVLTPLLVLSFVGLVFSILEWLFKRGKENGL